MQSWAGIARGVVEQIPLRGAQRGAERDWPERRPADPEHDDIRQRVIAGATALPLHEVERLRMQRAIVRQVEETKRALGVLIHHSLVRRGERYAGLGPFGGGDAAVDRRAHHVRVVEADGHVEGSGRRGETNLSSLRRGWIGNERGKAPGTVSVPGAFAIGPALASDQARRRRANAPIPNRPVPSSMSDAGSGVAVTLT